MSERETDRGDCVYTCAYIRKCTLAYADSMSANLRERDCAFEKRIVDEHMQTFMNVLRWHVCV